MRGHTPGPWTYDAHTGTVDAGGVAVAGINFDEPNLIDWDEATANAHLIETAPDFLAHARLLLDRLSEGRRGLSVSAQEEWAEELRALIAKATRDDE